jgi:hypothetical protein
MLTFFPENIDPAFEGTFRVLAGGTFLVLEPDKKSTLQMGKSELHDIANRAIKKKSVVRALLSTGELGTISFLNSDVKLIHRFDEDNGNTKS